MTQPPSENCTVRIVGLPLALQRRAQEQHDELMREFALVDMFTPSEGSVPVPQRLRSLIDTLVHQYGSVGAAPDAEREAARARGDATVDLTYFAPAAVGAACEALVALLDEADEYCRSGGQLLTLAASPELVAYRRWYLGEFSGQCRGAEPTSWAAYGASQGVVESEHSTPSAT